MHTFLIIGEYRYIPIKMALTIFLFKISNLDLAKTKSDTIQNLTTETINEENVFLCCAKVSFRGTFIRFLY